MIEKTEISRWRLSSDVGVHRWRYLNDEELARSPGQTDAERYLLGLELTREEDKEGFPRTSRSFEQAARAGWNFYSRLQLPEGHWACDYGGPCFLLPGLIFAMYISDTPIPDVWKPEIFRYLSNHVNEDGGWGLHLSGESTVFGTCLYYVVLRILGYSESTPLLSRARECLMSLGGAVGIPQWGKIWLSCLSLYGWDGVNCIPVDLWILPSWLPIHPSRWWVQCRVVYLPTSYLWSNRCSKPLNPLLEKLQGEIYDQPYERINFAKHRNTVAASDRKRSLTLLLRFFFFIITFWCNLLRPRWLLRYANRRVSDLMKMEEHNTGYECLAPVNKAFHMAATWFEEGSDSERLRRHRENVEVYMWMGPNGMTSNGTNGVQVWDTEFSILAAVEAGISDDPVLSPSLHKAHEFLEKSQFRDDLDDEYRQPRKGGWPFSTKSNGYIVSDCAAEGLRAIIKLQNEHSYPKLIDDSRLKECVDTLLLMQNSDDGFASYEKIRGSEYLELLNPAEVFDRIMVEYSYTECTTAVLTALAKFREHYPDYRASDVKRAISRAYKFVASSQRDDGSWYGSWAICFTYAAMFALKSFETVGQQHDNNKGVQKACKFLLSKQKDDGGWGEHHSSCEERRYIDHEKSQVVNTAWAVLALIYAGYPDPTPIQRGLNLILTRPQLIESRQRPNGEWLQEAVEGVFNQTWCHDWLSELQILFSCNGPRELQISLSSQTERDVVGENYRSYDH
ncbi:Lanosterol synthase [Golovinomyces cichoracearum]|uniref:Terpene cyclase/mutase family member n=1 Tax=Golovinomyces cichoracearum TaxID=62708 RepID=A0A420H777_9PEZI|nr:Lanosterol synthase [Golovinomyces cichoracearum]